MVEIGFKFDERDYSVKLLWELNQLRKSFEFLVEEANKYDINTDEYNSITAQAKDSAYYYFLYRNELDEYYKTM